MNAGHVNHGAFNLRLDKMPDVHDHSWNKTKSAYSQPAKIIEILIPRIWNTVCENGQTYMCGIITRLKSKIILI